MRNRSIRGGSPGGKRERGCRIVWCDDGLAAPHTFEWVMGFSIFPTTVVWGPESLATPRNERDWGVSTSRCLESLCPHFLFRSTLRRHHCVFPHRSVMQGINGKQFWQKNRFKKKWAYKESSMDPLIFEKKGTKREKRKWLTPFLNLRWPLFSTFVCLICCAKKSCRIEIRFLSP